MPTSSPAPALTLDPLGRPFVETDAGRKASCHPNEKRDCVVRATALAFGLSYDDAHEYMEGGGRVAGRGTPDDVYHFVWKSLAAQFGKQIVKHSFPAQRGKKRMNVLEFCKTHPAGVFITKQAGHVAAVIDGKLHDERMAWWSWNRCVYTAFDIIPTDIQELRDDKLAEDLRHEAKDDSDSDC